MRVGRLRTGELLALAGAVGLLAVLFLDWFGLRLERPEGSGGVFLTALGDSGWSTLGWPMDVALCVSAFGALSLAYVTLQRWAPAWPIGLSVLTSALGTFVWIALLVRVVTLADDGMAVLSVTALAPAYLGLVFAVLIPVGAWTAMRDERRDAPESAYTPPPVRPVPGT